MNAILEGQRLRRDQDADELEQAGLAGALTPEDLRVIRSLGVSLKDYIREWNRELREEIRLLNRGR